MFRLSQFMGHFPRNASSTFVRKLSTTRALGGAYESPMPDSFYDEEQKAIMQTMTKLIDTEVNPNIDEWEAKKAFPIDDLMKKFGEAGMLGVDKDPEFGGSGLSYKHTAAYLEALGTIKCGGISTAIAAHTEITLPALAKHGNNELKKMFLQPSITGEYIACVGISEPQAGSDMAAIKCNAKRVGDDLVINGTKMWITNGMNAHWMCLMAVTNGGPAYANCSLICVPMDAKGITRAKINKLGLHTSETAQIFFEDVKVPAKYIIGKEGMGFAYEVQQLQVERMASCLAVLKSLDLCISETIEYCQTRQAFGKSLLDNQVIHFRLAELATEVEHLRALVYLAVDLICKGEDVTRYASMAKLKCGRLCREVTDCCLQFWGGMGFTHDVVISRMYRDLRIISIYAGADEVMLLIISGLMNISPKPPKAKKAKK